MILGIDEVGRGCWAGPLVAAAVVLPTDFHLEDGPLGRGLQLKDSKKLSKIQREQLAEIIDKHALGIGIGWVWPEAIDSGGLTMAVKQAMYQALLAVTCEYDEIIIDGNINYFKDISSIKPVTAVIKADDSYPSVSAASIVAKVARDKYMVEAAKHYPDYGFEQHVGYGTALHFQAIKQYGIAAIHRQSFKPIADVLGSPQENVA